MLFILQECIHLDITKWGPPFCLLFTGLMSDVEITKLSSLDLLEEGDSIMAEKGFVLKKVLDGKDISVNTLLFSLSHGQFTKQEVEQTQIIAKLRIQISIFAEYFLPALLFTISPATDAVSLSLRRTCLLHVGLSDCN